MKKSPLYQHQEISTVDIWYTCFQPVFLNTYFKSDHTVFTAV